MFKMLEHCFLMLVTNLQGFSYNMSSWGKVVRMQTLGGADNGLYAQNWTGGSLCLQCYPFIGDSQSISFGQTSFKKTFWTKSYGPTVLLSYCPNVSHICGGVPVEKGTQEGLFKYKMFF